MNIKILAEDLLEETDLCTTHIKAWKNLADFNDDKSYDDSVKLKRTEMDPFRLS